MSIATFPALVGLTWPAKRVPQYSTIKQVAISGKETRLQLWTYPRYQYEISLSYLGSFPADQDWQNQDWQAFMGFFNELGGSALPFHWNDRLDNAITLGLIGTGDGTTAAFNFIRPLGGFVEPIQDVTAVSAIQVAGTPETHYTLLTDPNFGLTYGLQFAAGHIPASGAAITASFTYNWACRFDDDKADLNELLANFWELQKISFTSMKVL